MRTSAVLTIAVLLLAAIAATQAVADPLRSGDILVAAHRQVIELTRDGRVAQVVDVPENVGSGAAAGPLRDLAVTGDCRLAIIDGTLSPVLALWDPVTGEFAHYTIPDWNIGEEEYLGGIAAFGRWVFVADSVLVSGDAGGVIRVDIGTGDFERVLPEADVVDVTVGRDGRVYALVPTGCRVLDPETLDVLDTFEIDGGTRGLTLDEVGRFVTTNGVFALRSNPGASPNEESFFEGASDVDISKDGSYLFSGTRRVCLTKRSLGCFRTFSFDSDVFVAFVEQPLGMSTCESLLSPLTVETAFLELPPATLVGVQATARIVLRVNGVRVRGERDVRVEVEGPGIVLEHDDLSPVISGARTSRAVVRIRGGRGAIGIMAESPGELRFQVSSAGQDSIRFQGAVVEGFESSDGGFLHGGRLDTWTRGTPPADVSAHSGAQVWWSDRRSNVGGETYSFLDSPVWEVSSEAQHPKLEFWSWFDDPRDRGRGLIQIGPELSSEIPATLQITGASGGWEHYVVDLDEFIGGPVAVRFLHQVDTIGALWAIDDVRLTETAGSVRAVDGAGDSDADGVLDGEELERSTDPFSPDTDGDGLLDREETETGVYTSRSDAGSSPRVADSDSGGVEDLSEVLIGIDPNDASDDGAESEVNITLTDGDGFEWQFSYGTVVLWGAFKVTLDRRELDAMRSVRTISLPGGDSLLFESQHLGKLILTREIFISSMDGFVRIADMYRNTEDEPVNAKVSVRGEAYRDGSVLLAHSEGQEGRETLGEWVVWGPEPSRGEPMIALVFAGPNALAPATSVSFELRESTFEWVYDIVVPARDVTTVVYSIAQAASVDRAVTLAQELENPPVSEELLPTLANFSSGPVFHRGDANGDGRIDIADCICPLDWLFQGGAAPPCLDAADANDDGAVNCSDAIVTFRWLFLGEDPPPPPSPTSSGCGSDPTRPRLGCSSYDGCGSPSRDA